MSHSEFSGPPEADLAEGFAHHVAAWASAGGAPAESLPLLKAAARHVSRATAEGHVCAYLDELGADWPGLTAADLRGSLFASGMVAEAGDGRVLPMVLDEDGRLYLRRYFEYERRLAAALMARRAPAGGMSPSAPPSPALAAHLDALFAHNAARLGERPDWQKLAAGLAIDNRLTVISGGPGTGKTSTVAALLASLLEESPDLRIALAAPTGKAAARMREALRRRAADLPPHLAERLPREAYTVHRLLGVTPRPGRFRHDKEHPLPLDVLVVDEASMLDLALATHLLDAVPPAARLILLGDKDQLAAVEAGAVFSELCADPRLSLECRQRLAALTGISAERIEPPPCLKATPLIDTAIWFSESHRFAGDSGIGRLAARINRGEGAAPNGEDDSVAWLEDEGSMPSAATMERILAGFGAYREAMRQMPGDRGAVFRAFDAFRVLCALRKTPRGVADINERVERHLRENLDHPLDPGGRSPWYPGRPVMVRQNDHVLKLFNGDVGICLPDENNELMVYFPEPGEAAGEGAETGFRAVAPLRLPPVDTAFAMTVHKSQGSEFGEVLVLLPAQSSRVLTRELLYTAVTRAVRRVILAGSREVFEAACRNPTRRRTGLIARLTEAAGEGRAAE